MNMTLPILRSEADFMIYLEYKRKIIYGNKTWLSWTNGLKLYIIVILL